MHRDMFKIQDSVAIVEKLNYKLVPTEANYKLVPTEANYTLVPSEANYKLKNGINIKIECHLDLKVTVDLFIKI